MILFSFQSLNLGAYHGTIVVFAFLQSSPMLKLPVLWMDMCDNQRMICGYFRFSKTYCIRLTIHLFFKIHYGWPFFCFCANCSMNMLNILLLFNTHYYGGHFFCWPKCYMVDHYSGHAVEYWSCVTSALNIDLDCLYNNIPTQKRNDTKFWVYFRVTWW